MQVINLHKWLGGGERGSDSEGITSMSASIFVLDWNPDSTILSRIPFFRLSIDSVKSEEAQLKIY